MPFESKSQMRACYAQQALDLKAGREPKWDCAEFQAATPDAKALPERKDAGWGEEMRFRSKGITPQYLFDEKAKSIHSTGLPTLLAKMRFMAGSEDARFPSYRLQSDLLERIRSSKVSAVLSAIQQTANDAPETGTEVHPPLMINPYGDGPEAAEYENGYSHAQSLGHMALATADGAQWSRWLSSPKPWSEGFTSGAKSVGSSPMKTSALEVLAVLKTAALSTNAILQPIGQESYISNMLGGAAIGGLSGHWLASRHGVGDNGRSGLMGAGVGAGLGAGLGALATWGQNRSADSANAFESLPADVQRRLYTANATRGAGLPISAEDEDLLKQHENNMYFANLFRNP